MPNYRKAAELLIEIGLVAKFIDNEIEIARKSTDSFKYPYLREFYNKLLSDIHEHWMSIKYKFLQSTRTGPHHSSDDHANEQIFIHCIELACNHHGILRTHNQSIIKTIIDSFSSSTVFRISENDLRFRFLPNKGVDLFIFREPNEYYPYFESLEDIRSVLLSLIGEVFSAYFSLGIGNNIEIELDKKLEEEQIGAPPVINTEIKSRDSGVHKAMPTPPQRPVPTPPGSQRNSGNVPTPPGSQRNSANGIHK